MVNCGLGACSRTLESCRAGVATIALESGLAVGGLLANVFTLGGASASGSLYIAKKSIRKFAKKIGKKFIKATIRGIKTGLKKGKAIFKKKG